MPPTDSRFIQGPAGRIDSRWHGPDDGAPVLLMHPHPFHGGSMGTRLIHDLADALASDGHRVVRFDFRGVGRSDGSYDRGNGETEDALAVFDALAAESSRPVTVAGFSFGGTVAIHLAARRPVHKLVCIATPLHLRDADLAPADHAPSITAPVHLIYGTKDEFISRAEAETLAAAFTPTPHWHVLDGADHFLTPTHRPRCIEAVRQAMAE